MQYLSLWGYSEHPVYPDPEDNGMVWKWKKRKKKPHVLTLVLYFWSLEELY